MIAKNASLSAIYFAGILKSYIKRDRSSVIYVIRVMEARYISRDIFTKLMLAKKVDLNAIFAINGKVIISFRWQLYNF